MSRAAAALALVLAMIPAAGRADATARLLHFSDLRGWLADNHEAALRTFLVTCGDLPDPDWRALCGFARTGPRARDFFETLFRPVLIDDDDPPLITGYFEPELPGSKTRTDRFTVPIYGRPPDLTDGVPYASREEIETQGLLKDRGLEIAWVADPVQAFFLQVQGSGRIKLADGSVIRLAYAGKNGYPYHSIGMELVKRGVFTRSQVSASVIAAWVRDHGEEGRQLLFHNPSYVFFRELPGHDPRLGPIGAMNSPLTPMRSLAVDGDIIPLGAPVWVDRGDAKDFPRLMIAQDTGSAIKGAQRADIFFGSGPEAGREAGEVKDRGRLIVLLPIERALSVVESYGG